MKIDLSNMFSKIFQHVWKNGIDVSSKKLIAINFLFIFLVAGVSLSVLFHNDVAAIQQTAGKIDFELQPGQTSTMQWGFVSDSDEPFALTLRAEGVGSELLSFPKMVLMEPHQFVPVNITASIPSDYQNNVKLTPVIYATQFGEKGGSTIINIEMKKNTTIKIGNPPPDAEPKPEIIPETPSEIPQKEVSPTQVPASPEGTQIGSQETQVDPEPISATDKKSGGCLIATAAYGSELAPQVQLLREVRDNVLGTSSGTGFMTTFNAFYYSFSPTVADWERQNPVFKEAVRTALTPMLSTLSILNYVDLHSESEMLGYGISIILLTVGMYFVAPAAVMLYAKRKLNL
jgi:hypothetical protein